MSSFLKRLGKNICDKAHGFGYVWDNYLFKAHRFRFVQYLNHPELWGRQQPFWATKSWEKRELLLTQKVRETDLFLQVAIHFLLLIFFSEISVGFAPLFNVVITIRDLVDEQLHKKHKKMVMTFLDSCSKPLLFLLTWGVIILPTQTTHYQWVQNYPYICCLFDPPKKKKKLCYSRSLELTPFIYIFFKIQTSSHFV